MGIYNRDYMRPDGGGSNTVQIRGPKHWSAITWLVVINVVVFLAQHLFIQPNLGKNEMPWGGLENDTIQRGKLWGIITHLFVHGSLMHLFFNMLMLIMFGRFIQKGIGSKRFLKLYFFAGILSGLVSLGIYWYPTGSYSVGASGAVMAVVVASCFAYGELPMRLLFPPITVKFKMLGYFIIGIELIRLLFMLVAGRSTLDTGAVQVGVVAHLVGIAVGFLYVKYFLDLGYQDSYGGGMPVVTPRKAKIRKPKKPAKKKPLFTKDVDAILDKINEKGFQSLTDEEKKILDSRSEELSDRGRK